MLAAYNCGWCSRKDFYVFQLQSQNVPCCGVDSGHAILRLIEGVMQSIHAFIFFATEIREAEDPREFIVEGIPVPNPCAVERNP